MLNYALCWLLLPELDPARAYEFKMKDFLGLSRASGCYAGNPLRGKILGINIGIISSWGVRDLYADLRF